MDNIFENAYFGKPYKTSENTIALYLGEEIGDFKYRLAYPIISDITNKPTYIILQCDEFGCSKSDIDIVSEWQESIDEEKLEELANEYASRNHRCYACYDDDTGDWYNRTDKPTAKKAFEAGYRKALES